MSEAEQGRGEPRAAAGMSDAPQPSARPSRAWADGLGVAAVAFVLRLGVVLWAWGRIPPVADGSYYHTLAGRLAAGLGYTWLWPDGAVTYASHYPVGYPGALAGLYAIFGPTPHAAMLLNALLGALSVLAVHQVLAGLRRRRVALIGAGLLALHPGLIGYTPALMTEGVTASLLCLGGWCAFEARRAHGLRPRIIGLLGLGVLLGLATLVRPQSILLAPLLGALAASGWASGGRGPRVGRRPILRRLGAGLGRHPVGTGLVVTVVALAVCAPWTARNCVRMGRCALVSVNGGWNLLIGTDPEADGGWAPLEVPTECQAVFDEAQKDQCFGRAARRRIQAEPAAWLALAPRKAAATFDYCGAAGWYLHESNPEAFSYRAKVVLGAVETVYERSMLLLALVALWPRARPWWAVLPVARGGVGRRRVLRAAAVAIGMGFALMRAGWLGYLLLLVALALRRPWLHRGPVAYGASFAVLLSVMATHAVFFGGGRYSLVALPWLCTLAALGLARCGRRRAA